jgi:gamma-glutamyltranspeptidase/glutathione hydrolase
MSKDLAANGAYVTAADLDEYQAADEQAVTGTYRGYDITTSQAPHGGPTVIEILNILEGYNLQALGHNSAEYIYLVAMAMKAAFTDRNAHLGDPRAGAVPVRWMTSKARAKEWQAHIDAGKPITVGDTPTTPPDTTHISVVDNNGMCVALTHSLGMSSGVITPGLGFMYNNSMVNFHPFPGHRNSIAPRVGRTTGMAPTIISKDGKPILVLGAPGASRIITAVLQVIVNFIDFGMSISDAIAAPRIDCQGNNIVCHGRIPEYICEVVRQRHPISRLPQSYGAMAFVQAVSLRDGVLQGGTDPGCSGVALHV